MRHTFTRGSFARLRNALCCAMLLSLAATAARAKNKDWDDEDSIWNCTTPHVQVNNWDCPWHEGTGCGKDPTLTPTVTPTPTPATSVPLPSGVWGGLAALGTLGVARLLRRRNVSQA